MITSELFDSVESWSQVITGKELIVVLIFVYSIKLGQ